MLQLVKYIKVNGLENLQHRYAIAANRHQKYPNLVCFKYSHRHSPMNSEIVHQARGIILDEANDWEIISYPYKKFFNHGEKYAAKIDWKTAKVYEKLDGSLVVLYYYDNRWWVQTSGRADASGLVKNKSVSFCELFWQVFWQLNYQLPKEVEFCYMFELMTPINRVVVPQVKNRLVLHGVRNLVTLEEEKPEKWAEKYNWEVVKTFNFKDFKSVLEEAKNLPIVEGEGFVVCDRSFHRQKIKASQYVLLAYDFQSLLRENSNPVDIESKILELILIQECDEFLAYFPELVPSYQKVKVRLERLIDLIQNAYEKYQGITDQKEFALNILNHPFKDILFGLRNQKFKTVKQGLGQLGGKKLQLLYKSVASSI